MKLVCGNKGGLLQPLTPFGVHGFVVDTSGTLQFGSLKILRQGPAFGKG